MVTHACNPSTWETETGGSGFEASLSYLVRPCFKIKNKKKLGWGCSSEVECPWVQSPVPPKNKKVFKKNKVALSMIMRSSLQEKRAHHGDPGWMGCQGWLLVALNARLGTSTCRTVGHHQQTLVMTEWEGDRSNQLPEAGQQTGMVTAGY